MNALADCPHCGLPLAHHGTNGSNSAAEDRARIQELTREVRSLQKTVAQLRAVRR
jgi:uncharacterized protein YlxW (UPF0749 family)